MKLDVSAAVLAFACVLVPGGLAQEPAPTPAPAPAPQAPATPKLAVGSPAPALAIESTIQGEPVTALAKGKTYLLHFWAPWNKASVDELDALAAAQRRLADQGLVVIAIASTDANGTTVEKARAALAEKALPFAVAWDKGTATKDAYLKAAGRTRLPGAAIVDREGRIAFLEDAALGLRFLDAIVAGTYDPAAMAAWQAKAERLDKSMKDLATAYQARKWAEVVPLVDEILEVDPIGRAGYVQARMLALARMGSADKALEWARAWLEGAGKESAEGHNAIAWVLVDPAEPFPKPDLVLAEKAAVRAAELSKHEDGAVLDTLARVRFVQGDVAQAIELQKKALERLKPAQMQFKPQIEASLREYEAALAKKKEG